MGDGLGGFTGLGPVFAFEWLTSARRWQGYAVRSLFVAMLLAALVVVWSSWRVESTSVIHQMARLGEQFYVAVAGTQLALVLLAAPAATAGSICLDRARGSMTHLLVTDLSDAEIVLGKLAARLVPVLGMVGCALPVMAILTLLGGVDPGALFGAFLVTVGVALLGCSLAMVFSLWVGKTHEALLATYAVWLVWLLADPIVDTFNGLTGLSVPRRPWASDPFSLVFSPSFNPGRVTSWDYVWFLGVTAAVSTALVALAVLRLRAVCTRVNVRKAVREASWWRRRVSVRLLPGPSLDANPVLWREWHRNRASGWSRALVRTYFALAACFSLSAVVSGQSMQALWVNGFQLAVGLLLLSVSASSSLAEERVRGSLDVLMTTPLTTRQIVLGKWLGAFRLVPLLAVLPTLVALPGVLEHPQRWPGAVLLVVYILVSGAAVTSLGLAMATWYGRVGRAVWITVAADVVMTVGVFFAVVLLLRHEEAQLLGGMGSPFYAGAILTVELYEPRMDWYYCIGAVLWTFFYAVSAAGFLLATLASFNRCLGRLDSGPPLFGRAGPEPGPVELLKVEEERVVGPEFASR